MARKMTMSAFLGHKTRSEGGGKFLKGWRNRTPAAVNTFMHRKADAVALWQHGLPRIFEQKTDGDDATTRRVFGGKFNCHEDEAVLLKQYLRDRDTGERVVPPVVCPVCKLMESLRGLYTGGELALTEPLFKWEGDDPNETQIITLGGMLNLYGKELTPDQKREVKAKRVRLNEAWKENANAKCNYLFVVVDADSAEDGVQLAIETTALGDQVKECIHGQLTALGEEDGNPMEKPYAIRWEHHPTAKEFGKRYKAIAMPKVRLTGEIKELIDSDPPDVLNIIKPGNVANLRAELESRCILDDPDLIPWDEIFAAAELIEAEAGEAEAEATPDAAESTAQMKAKRGASKKKAVSKTRTRKKVEPEPEPDPEPEEEVEEEPDEGEEEVDEGLEQCEEEGCDNMMGPEETTCSKCGAEYAIEEGDEEPEEEPEPEPEPEKPKRGRKKATAKKKPGGLAF